MPDHSVFDHHAWPSWRPGDVFAGRYRIVAPLGGGGMGKVYLAEDMKLNGKRRALKLTAHPGADPDSFIGEAKLLTELQHPHLPDIVDYYPPGGQGWAVIVTEYIPGETLAGMFRRCGGRIPFSRTFRYLGHLCDVLIYLHARKPPVVFRDLKPANVIIDRHDRAVLVDFGIARTYRPGASSDTERLGTPAFAAPEQVRGEQTDARTDLYGWGALAYYLLSGGQFAYRAGKISGSRLQPDVPGSFRGLLELVLRNDPEGRPASARELREQLVEIAAGLPQMVENRYGRMEAESGADKEVSVAAVLSAYPGAGATFSALGLSRFLAGKQVPHALVEFPGGEPELYALLDGRRRMPKRAAFADPDGLADPFPPWRKEATRYYPLDPGCPVAMPGPEFAAWIRSLGVPLVLLDVSGNWERPGAADWLMHNARSIWWVADCLPAKWSARRQEAAAELERQACGRGIATGWIANRDHTFPMRREWIAVFRDAPAAILPLVPQEDAVLAAWRGEGYPEGALRGAAARAFQSWALAVIESNGK